MRKSLVLICLSLAFALVGRAEKTSVFFVHGANVGEQDARAWASEMFKRLWQAGANMEFCPVAWESDIGPSYNYFYSSGDEVLELYAGAHNPAWYNGVSPSGNWGDRYSWHKQEIWKGRKSLLGFMGTTDWSKLEG